MGTRADKTLTIDKLFSLVNSELKKKTPSGEQIEMYVELLSEKNDLAYKKHFSPKEKIRDKDVQTKAHRKQKDSIRRELSSTEKELRKKKKTLGKVEVQLMINKPLVKQRQLKKQYNSLKEQRNTLKKQRDTLKKKLDGWGHQKPSLKPKDIRNSGEILTVGQYKRNLNHIIRIKNEAEKININHKLFWKILPTSSDILDGIYGYLENISEKNRSNSNFNERRLRTIVENLNPTSCYLGLDEFEGYVVFCFDYTEKVVFENPLYGNAVYVVSENWKQFSRHTKTELLSHEAVSRIIHKGDWVGRIKSKLSTS